MALFQALQHLQCTPGDNASASALNEALEEAASRMRAGTRIIVISDFHTLSSAGLVALGQCAARGLTTAIMVFDTLEASLPVAADYPVTDGLRRFIIAGKHRRERQRYASQFDAHRAQLARQLLAQDIELLSIDTPNAPLKRLTDAMQPWTTVP